MTHPVGDRRPTYVSHVVETNLDKYIRYIQSILLVETTNSHVPVVAISRNSSTKSTGPLVCTTEETKPLFGYETRPDGQKTPHPMTHPSSQPQYWHENPDRPQHCNIGKHNRTTLLSTLVPYTSMSPRSRSSVLHEVVLKQEFYCGITTFNTGFLTLCVVIKTETSLCRRNWDLLREMTLVPDVPDTPREHLSQSP